MTHIKAPFNFVPFSSERIFYPTWADYISQDIPFEDGVSGQFTLNIEAHSPIFVRNGNLEGKEAIANDNDFSNHNGQYFIPGTSIKGMLRSVLEIMSFGKLSVYNNHRYAIRDLGSSKNYYMQEMKNIRCGWLEKTSNGYRILDWGKPGRIKHDEIGTTMQNHFHRGGLVNEERFSDQNDEQKTAMYKYENFASSSSNLYSQRQFFDKKRNPKKTFAYDNYEKYKIGTEEEGVLVFTGQPSKSKNFEFIFFKPSLPIIEHDVSPELFQDIKFAYVGDSANQSVDWLHFEGLLKRNEKIPIFFKLKDTKTKKREVAHFGLAYLYKLPYKYSIHSYLNQQKFSKLDMAECIFGKIESEKEENGTSLKGRVHIGHALADRNSQPLETHTKVLSSPKASYYPIYIKQDIENGKVKGEYKDYKDVDAKLAGRKRYPIHRNFNPSLGNPEKGQENVATSFKPLNKGSQFKTTVSYHNLRKIELGALLSAITFHNTKDCFHSIGMAKPLGYGKIKVSINGLEEEAQKEYMKIFEEEMNAALNKNWASTDALTELVTMASEQDNRGTSTLEYMKMDIGNKNEFVEAKKAGEALDRYSKLDSIKVNVKKLNSFSSERRATSLKIADLASLKQQLEQLKAECEALSEKKKKEQKEQEIKKEKEEAHQKLLEEIKANKAPKTLDTITPSAKIKKVLGPLRTYLGKRKIEETESAKIFTLLKSSKELATNNRDKKDWNKELPKFLNKYMDDGDLRREWLNKILKN